MRYFKVEVKNIFKTVTKEVWNGRDSDELWGSSKVDQELPAGVQLIATELDITDLLERKKVAFKEAKQLLKQVEPHFEVTPKPLFLDLEDGELKNVHSSYFEEDEHGDEYTFYVSVDGTRCYSGSSRPQMELDIHRKFPKYDFVTYPSFMRRDIKSSDFEDMNELLAGIDF